MQSMPRIDVETGQWEYTQAKDLPIDAIDTFTRRLNLRIERVAAKVVMEIEKTMTANISSRSSYQILFAKAMDKVKAEVQTHSSVCDRFAKSQLTTDGESQLLQSCNETLNKIVSAIDATVKCWNQLIKLYKEKDPQVILKSLREIKEVLDTFRDDTNLHGIYEAFFYLDDATRGLLRIKKWGQIAIHEGEAMEKYIDCILRQLLKEVNTFPNTEATQTINAAIQKIQEIGHKNDPYLAVLNRAIAQLEHDEKTLYDRLF